MRLELSDKADLKSAYILMFDMRFANMPNNIDFSLGQQPKLNCYPNQSYGVLHVQLLQQAEAMVFYSA